MDSNLKEAMKSKRNYDLDITKVDLSNEIK